MEYCESTIIHWYQFPWFLQKALIHGFLNSWFQTLQATINDPWVYLPKVPKIYYFGAIFSDPIVEVNAVVRHFRLRWVFIRKIWQ